MDKNQKSILFIIFSLGNGGSEKMLLNILNGAKLPGVRKILYLYNDNLLNSFEDQLTVPVKIYSSSSSSSSGVVRVIKRIKSLINIINDENVNIVFSFSTQGAFLAALVKTMFPFRKIKLVVRLGTVFKFLFTDTRVNKFKNKLWEWITLFFTYKRMNKIVCSTNYMSNELKMKLGGLNGKITTIKNYLDKDKINLLLKEDIDYSEEFIVCVGRLEREKNYAAIIEAFNLIKDKIAASLLILGDGSLKQEVKDQISTLGLEERVVLKGFQKNPYKYIARADSFVLFSDYEGMPNSVIEAFACKTPVIVSDFLGVEDLVTHNLNGLIVPRGNIKLLAEYMLKLSTDSDLKSGLVKEGYKASEEFTTTVIRYEKVITDLMKN